MEGLTEGRIVHYVMPDGRNRGEDRPAIVVRVWRVDGKPPANGVCQLAVFVDGTNDYVNLPMDNTSFMPVIWKTSVVHSAEHEFGTWHWIEPA